MEAGIKDLFDSEKYKNYLRAMSKFHNYSFNNTMLIHMQKPEATRVASFNSWRDKFRRNVKRGERGIKIIKISAREGRGNCRSACPRAGHAHR